MRKKEVRLVVLLIIILTLTTIISTSNNNAITDKSITGEITGETVTGEATSQSISMNLSVTASVPAVTISAPLNTTYNFSIGDELTMDLNTSANFPVNEWRYTLLNLKHNTIISENTSFTPNTNFNAVRWSNLLTIYADNYSGSTTSSNVTFFINVPNATPTILNLPSEIYGCEQSTFSYLFNITDPDEETTLATISPRSLFYVIFDSTANLTTRTYEIYSGTLNKEDAGGINQGSQTYERSIMATDRVFSDSKTINITIIEINQAPNITNPGVYTIRASGENSTFYHETQVTDTENGDQDSGNLSFNITIKNPEGQNVDLFNISASGIMNFTSNFSETGVYNITIHVTDKGLNNPHENISLCRQDGDNITSSINFSLTISDENRAPSITSYEPSKLIIVANSTDTLNFNITKYDPDDTIPDTYWYVDNTLKEYDTGSSTDTFFYTFGCGFSGMHRIKSFITDSKTNGLNDSVEWILLLYNIPCPNLTSPLPGTGGGGGGSLACKEKWGCEEWKTCKNLEEALEKGEITGENYRNIKAQCSKLEWDTDLCGFQTRYCTDFNNCGQNNKIEFQECYFTEKPNCYDGIKNCHDGSCELLVDCGGPCLPCPTCSDGIKNQGEEDTDCGGPCPWPCDTKESKLQETSAKKFSIILLVILLIIIIIETIKIIKLRKNIKREIKKIKIHPKVYPTLIIALTILALLFIYFYAKFDVGDFIYKKDKKELIGELENKSLTLNYLIEWQNGEYGKEYVFSIGKIEYLNEKEIREALENNNEKDFALYTWDKTGKSTSSETPIKRVEDLREYAVRTGEEQCRPGFICGEWSDCRINYGLANIEENKLTSGRRYRTCKDYTRCMSDFIYSENCEIKSDIITKTTETDEGSQIEVYNEENNLVAIIKKKILKGIEKLDIKIIVE